jgi:hypothetical protein
MVLATILVKNVPEDLLKELKRLKVELGCKTWADLLFELVSGSGTVLLNKEKEEQMEKGIKGFLSLRCDVSNKWHGQPTVLEESRKSRHHNE